MKVVSDAVGAGSGVVVVVVLVVVSGVDFEPPQPTRTADVSAMATSECAAKRANGSAERSEEVGFIGDTLVL